MDSCAQQCQYPLTRPVLLLASLLIAGLCSVAVQAQNNTGQDADATTGNNYRPPQTQAARLQLLADSLPNEQVLWLNADDEDFLAVIHPALRPEPRGWVVLLHGSGQAPHWQGHLNHLQATLPKQGWSTLSLALPEPQVQPLSARPKQAQVTGDNASDGDKGDDGNDKDTDQTEPALQETGQAIETLAAARVSAAFAHLQTDATPAIALLGQGTGATRIAQYLATADQAPVAIVLLDGLNTLPYGEAQLPEALGLNPALPILDITTSRRAGATHPAATRRDYAKRQGLDNYQNTALHPPTPTALSRLVDGFLRRHTENQEK